ncbi:MAG: hypothetical protein LWX56_10195 [Ignavibacteria bacterium]|nr:hypothetical protein [Ignavibacteria bacterium]
MISIVIFTPEQSNVTRLPAIKIWLGNLMQGIFPYKSPVNPSGFPGLFLLAMPFYLMGLAQVLCIFGYVIFIFFLRISERNEKSASTVLLLLALSPMLFYEVMVRSELLLNGALLLLLYSITKKNLQKDSISPQFIAAAAGFGFLLSTRLTAWPITAILVLPLIGSRLNKFFVFTGISLGVFALTLIPFLAWDYNYFMHSGPFAIQSLYLPGWFMLCAGLFALAVAGKLQAEKESFFFTGVFLFILVAVSFSIHISQNGIFNSLFERPLFDISYFILALPFLVSAYDTAGTK